jgi:hypothetical protein
MVRPIEVEGGSRPAAAYRRSSACPQACRTDPGARRGGFDAASASVGPRQCASSRSTTAASRQIADHLWLHPRFLESSTTPDSGGIGVFAVGHRYSIGNFRSGVRAVLAGASRSRWASRRVDPSVVRPCRRRSQLPFSSGWNTGRTFTATAFPCGREPRHRLRPVRPDYELRNAFGQP